MLMPHCDPSVLHAPGKCKYCDNCPKGQEYRQLARINFSDEHDSNKAPCPSTYFRSEETVNLWGGNRVQPAEEKEIR
ncbi:hypothetical protein LCGC14_0264460 [marine sediment metagenome]|uniref:Uncharacterized protein n=1 Tax=marine sediment metagenome TaxID=412755 RepID=A0A0F9U5K7_9ZZZZ